MGIGLNNYDQLIKDDVETISKKNRLYYQNRAKHDLIVEKSTNYLTQAIKTESLPNLKDFVNFVENFFLFFF